MLQTNRRTAFKLLGGAAVSLAAVPAVPRIAAAQELTVPNSIQNFKRGTIHSMHPEKRSFVIIWQDLGRVKMKAADLVANFNQLKPGQIIDTHWYDYMDFLIAKQTPQTTAQGKQMVAQGAYLAGIPGARQRINLWMMEGMVTKVDPATNTIYLINATGNQTDEPPPNPGEVIQMPQITTANGKAAFATIKPGEMVTCVFSQQTAIDATIIREGRSAFQNGTRRAGWRVFSLPLLLPFVVAAKGRYRRFRRRRGQGTRNVATPPPLPRQMPAS